MFIGGTVPYHWVDLFLSVRNSFGCHTRVASTTPCTPPPLHQPTSNPTLSPLHSETWFLSGKALVPTNCLASSFPCACSCSRNLAVDNFTVYESYPTQEEDWFLSQPSILSSLSLSYRYQASSSDILQPGAAGDQCSPGRGAGTKRPLCPLPHQ